jgi:hypothetical protein
MVERDSLVEQQLTQCRTGKTDVEDVAADSRFAAERVMAEEVQALAQREITQTHL